MEKELLESYYLSGKSMKQISNLLNCSPSRVRYWMTRYNISRRSHSDATYLHANPSGDPFKIEKVSTSSKDFLFGIGMGIFWGEGNKVDKRVLRISNTDPELIKSFVYFLKKICNINEQRLSYSIICFNDADTETARKYWAEKLDVDPKKFGKITQIEPQGKGTYKRKSQYGVCIAQANNIKLRAWLFNELEVFKQSLPG